MGNKDSKCDGEHETKSNFQEQHTTTTPLPQHYCHNTTGSKSNSEQSDIAKCRNELLKKGFEAVVGIDFGTTNSAITFDILREPLEANPNDRVKGLPPDGDFHHRIKGCTCLYQKPNGEYKVGETAKKEYVDALEACDAEGQPYTQAGLFFEKFKMSLHKLKDIKTASVLMVSPHHGEPKPLAKVITETLRCLKKNALNKLRLISHNINPDKVQWSITIPAIWTNVAKQVMRQCANDAGLIKTVSAENLLFALEPEAAALTCCSQLKQEKILKTGKVFVVADNGGGTLDFVAFEVTGENPLKLESKMPPTGTANGSTKINSLFKDFLARFFGNSHFEHLQKKHASAFTYMMGKFEMDKIQHSSSMDFQVPFRLDLSALCKDDTPEVFKKRVRDWNDKVASKDVSASASFPCKTRPSTDLNTLIETKEAESFDDILAELPENMKELDCTVHDKRRVLKIKLQFLWALTNHVVKKAINDLSQVVKKLKEKNKTPDCILMVGGFSLCDRLYDGVRSQFSTIKVFKPIRCENAVAIGSIRYAWQPTLVTVRVAEYSFGVGTHVKGKSGNPGFLKYVEVGESVECHTPRVHTLHPVYPNQTSIAFQIRYHPAKDPPELRDDTFTEFIYASLPCDTSKEKCDSFKVEMYFGLTEVRIVATSNLTGKTISKTWEPSQ